MIPHLTDEIKKFSFLPHMSLDHITDSQIRPKDRFLRGHLFQTLSVHLLGGDVQDDFGDLSDYLQNLGIYDNNIDPSDPEWETLLGREVWAMLVRSQLAK